MSNWNTSQPYKAPAPYTGKPIQPPSIPTARAASSPPVPVLPQNEPRSRAGMSGVDQPAPQPVQPGQPQQPGQSPAPASSGGNIMGNGGGANPYNLPPDLVQGMTQSQQLGGLLGQFEQSRQDTNQANESRYQDIMGQYGNLDQAYAQRTQDLTGQMEGFGQAQEQALNQKFEQQRASQDQDHINRGLYNSTALDSARQGTDRQQQQQQLQLSDMLQRQKMDFGARITGEELGNRGQKLQFMERREDVGPSYQDVAGVAGAVGSSMAGVPDYQSALGFGGQVQGGPSVNTGGPAPATSQAPDAGKSPVYTGVGDTGGVNYNAPDAQFGMPPSSSGPASSGGPSGGGTSGGGGGGDGNRGGGGGGGGQGSPTPTGEGEEFPSTKPSSSPSDRPADEPAREPPGGAKKGDDTLLAETGTGFYAKNIATQLKANPNWEWWNDGIIRAMAPTNLQERMNEIGRTRNLAHQEAAAKTKESAAKGGGGWGNNGGFSGVN